jgi:hypothetical protein
MLNIFININVMKKSTKTFLLLFAITLSSFGQVMVTNDVKTNATLSSQLAQAAEQLKQLEENIEIITTAQNKYEEIYSVVSSIFDMNEITQLSKEAFTNISLVEQHTKLKGKSRERLIKGLQRTVTLITRKVSEVVKVGQKGFFKMTDKERIDMFKEYRNEIFSLVVATRGPANPYRPR